MPDHTVAAQAAIGGAARPPRAPTAPTLGIAVPPSVGGTIHRPERLSGTGRALPIDDHGEHHHLVDGHGAHSVGADASRTRLGMYLGTT